MSRLLVVDITDFIGGRNTTVSEPLMQKNESPNELNVKSRPVGVLARRGGWIRYFPLPFGVYPSVITGLHKLYRSKDIVHELFVYQPPNLWSIFGGSIRANAKDDFSPDTFCDFISMQDMAYGTNFADLPFRAQNATVNDAQLPYPEVPFSFYDGINQDGTPGCVTIVDDPTSKWPGGIIAYKFRAYFGPDLGESMSGRVSRAATRNGATATQVVLGSWTTFMFDYPASPTGPPDTGAAARLNLDNIVVPPGTKKLRVYRTQRLSSVPTQSATPDPPIPSYELIQNAPYYFLDDISWETPQQYYYDKKSDDELGALMGPDPVYHPYARYIEEHQNRAWLANTKRRWLERATKDEMVLDGQADTDDKWLGIVFWFNEGPMGTSDIYYSFAFEPSRMQGYEPIFPEDGDEITGIRSVGPVLVVFKRRHIYTVLGVPPLDLAVRLASSDIGCIAPRSLAKWHEIVYFFEGKDIYRFDGTSVEAVGTKIRADLEALPQPFRQFAVGVVHQERYLLSVAEAS